MTFIEHFPESGIKISAFPHKISVSFSELKLDSPTYFFKVAMKGSSKFKGNSLNTDEFSLVAKENIRNSFFVTFLIFKQTEKKKCLAEILIDQPNLYINLVWLLGLCTGLFVSHSFILGYYLLHAA